MGEISRKHIPMLRYAFFLLIGIIVEQYFHIPFLLIATIYCFQNRKTFSHVSNRIIYQHQYTNVLLRYT